MTAIRSGRIFFVVCWLIDSLFFILPSCSVQKQISKSANSLLKAPSLETAHVGISIYEPAADKYWFNYQADHYFVPASNIKIPTCYAAMKYLGDSLVAIIAAENDTAIFFLPNGDPTFLHPDFPHQPAVDYLQRTGKKLYTSDIAWQESPLGSGWAWDDYNDDYMAERSPLPVYGNLIEWFKETGDDQQSIVYSIPEVNWSINFDTGTSSVFHVARSINENSFKITEGREKIREQSVPFVTNGIHTAAELLSDTIHKTVTVPNQAEFKQKLSRLALQPSSIHSQAVDSMLRPMMRRSDNFFAEQSLLMVSNKLLGVMNDERIIDTLLKTDFSSLPQTPYWVDGSGLSRYNLFSPQDFVFILNKMKNEFGMERIEHLLPTGNEGTLRNYYVRDSGYIYAKTGSLSGVLALSGFLHTQRHKLLIFSLIVNNHNASSSAIRRAIESFIEGVRNKY